MSRMSRAWLVGAFRQRVEEANEFLDRLAEENYDSLLYDEWGGVMSDPDIMTREGRFRNNASRLNMEELEYRIQILDSLLEDEVAYDYEGEELRELERRLNVKNTSVNGNVLLTLVDYMKGKIKEGELDSYQIVDIAKARLEHNENITLIKLAFDKAVKEANGDPVKWFNIFSKRGKLI